MRVKSMRKEKKYRQSLTLEKFYGNVITADLDELGADELLGIGGA
jgi:hypothetical protein